MSQTSGSTCRTAWISTRIPTEAVTTAGMLNTGTRGGRGRSGVASISAPLRGPRPDRKGGRRREPGAPPKRGRHV